MKKYLPNISNTRKIGLLSTFAIVGCLFMSSAAHAKSCSAMAGSSLVTNDNFKFPRGSSLQRNMPLFKASQPFNYMCSQPDQSQLNKFHYEIKINSPSNQDGSYPTNIPGISIKYTIDSGRNCVPDAHNKLKGTCSIDQRSRPANFRPTISLQTKPGTYMAGKVSVNHEMDIYYSFGNDPQRKLGTLLSGNLNFSFQRYGCTVDNPTINFDLGKQQSGDFTRIGPHKHEIKKQIALTCDPNTKYFLQIDGDAEPNYPGVLKLTPEPGAAHGVGVQLLVGYYKEAVFGQPKQMGTAAANGTDIKETIDIIARYYQTENSVIPGKANASATFTLTYQ
ncbi:fimbrial protein [Yersinia hibernica]|nr:fimbrial protein [Yersinia hibernica]